MVQLLIGHKGSGKTKMMCDMANTAVENAHGSIVFISKDSRCFFSLKHKIRVTCMEDFKHITTIDEYIGFIYGIISSDHDLEQVYIDSILKHADVTLKDIPEFIRRLNNITAEHGTTFVVSLSADKAELENMTFNDCQILN